MNRRHVGLSLVVATLIIVGGCFSMAVIDEGDETDADTFPGEVDDTSAADSEPPSERIHPANPYGTKTLTVGIDESKAERDTEPLVREALDYWEANAEEYAGYPIEYELEPNASDPDVQITWTEEVSSCDLSYDTYLLGCADIPGERAPETASVVVETGLVRNDTVELLEHELGHTLGLTHEDEPASLMAAEMNATPRVTHVDVQLVWHSDDHDRDEVTEQVRRSLEYYESWTRTHTETNLTYDLETSEIRTPNEHDFYIELSDDRDLCGGNVSCANYAEGGVLKNEAYTVRYADIRADAVGWYTGNYVGSYMALEVEELPATFQNADTDHILGEWWDE